MNPYVDLPDTSFWSRAVSRRPHDVDPVVEPRFHIGRSDKVVTIGSCFAQHISRALVHRGFNYLITETVPATSGATDENFGTFSARYGNIYTVRQALQLFQRAYGLIEPATSGWLTADGRALDPFRPNIQKRGFPDLSAMLADREAHFRAVRDAFETSDVLIFTLGLTEAWANASDGTVVPLAPGVVGVDDSGFKFENFSVPGMSEDLAQFISKLRMVNPGLRILLTVSPVPLVATYEKRHVLVSTIYSKSALRVVAEMIAQDFPEVDYFPSYEIVTGPQAQGRFFAGDLRSVTPEAVEHVMGIFSRHYLSDETYVRPRTVETPCIDLHEIEQQYESICDEEALDN